MSLRAMLWALEDAPVDDHGALLVLIALADRANDDGTAAWPSRAWLAERARCSERSVQRKLNDLREAGIIAPGDQHLLDHIRPDRRPVVYDLDLSLVRGDNLAPRVERGDKLGRTGRQTGSNGETALAHNTSSIPYGIETTHEPSVDSSLALIPSVVAQDDPFDAWWATYPRKTAKAAARKAYNAAVRRGRSPQFLAEQLAGYPFPADPSYVMHAATWLNGERWADEQVKRAGPPMIVSDWGDGRGFYGETGR